MSKRKARAAKGFPARGQAIGTALALDLITNPVTKPACTDLGLKYQVITPIIPAIEFGIMDRDIREFGSE